MNKLSFILRTALTVLLIVVAYGIVPPHSAKADTFSFYDGNGTVSVSVTLDKNVYTPGEGVTAMGYVTTYPYYPFGSPAMLGIFLGAGIPTPQVYPVCAIWLFPCPNSSSILTAWLPLTGATYAGTPLTLTAPSQPGSYSVTFDVYSWWGLKAASYAIPFTVVPLCAAGYGSSCTSAPNACGQTQANGTIQCNGSCSSTPPPDSNCSPDLTAGSTTASPSSGTTGTSESFSATVSNTGIGPASNFPNIFQIANSALTATIAMLNANTITSLASGASTGISGAYTFSSAGSYNVRACANYNTSWGGSITETNLNNNCGAWLPLTVSWAACTNGANNPPSCNQCPSNLAYVSGSCVACSNGGCTGTPGGSASNPTGSLVCNNGAVNPPSCNAFIPTATLSASPTTIDQGQSSTLSWNSTNATACVGTGFTAGGPSGTRSTGTLSTAGTATYQVVCSGAGGSSLPAFASVEVLAPDATISASPARVQSGTNSEISWSASGVTSCTVTGPSGTLASGNADASHAFSTGSPISATISAQSTFTITCQTNGAPISRSVTVNLLTDFEEF